MCQAFLSDPVLLKEYLNGAGQRVRVRGGGGVTKRTSQESLVVDGQ